MSYRCNDCSYTRRGVFPNGMCPACGSYNISRSGETDSTDDSTDQGKRWRLLLSVVLWIILACLLYRKI